jgi:uncharacterized RDD family membrane protein YckC
MPYQPASFWRRLLARIIDLGFSLVLAFVLVIPVGLIMFPFVPLVDRNIWTSIGAGVCYFLAYVALEFFLLVRRNGQSLGKGLMGLRVVTANERTSDQVQPAEAMTRLFVLFAPFVLGSISGGNSNVPILVALGNLAFVALLATLVLTAVPVWNRRALHDYAARTRVVQAPRRGVSLRQDVRMMVPGKIDMTKRL